MQDSNRNSPEGKLENNSEHTVLSITGTTNDNPGMQTGFVPEEDSEAVPLSTDAEALLRALQNMITPLIRLGEGKNKHDAKPSTFGPEGHDFIITLQKFMSSFFCSQRGLPGGIEVELTKKKEEILSPTSSPNDFSGPNDWPSQLPDISIPEGNSPPVEYSLREAFSEPESASNESPVSEMSPNKNIAIADDIVKVPWETVSLQNSRLVEQNTRSQDGVKRIETNNEELSVIPGINKTIPIYKVEKRTLLEKLLKSLRELIFNTMPIRLLYFRQHASKLQISLMERGAIYAHIASKLDADIKNSEFYPQIIDLGEYIYSTHEEAEESIIMRLIGKYSRYAILSHTWLREAPGEVTFGHWNRREFNVEKLGYRKLVNFCKAAWEDHGLTFGWMDTICINKESSAELDESIRSMYKWYRGAHICITYLAETIAPSDIHQDTWFTRGWTLQELLAPDNIKFYNAEWKRLVESSNSDKQNPLILEQIEQATTITAHELTRSIVFRPVSRRMQMAARRQVTREEDIAYSLMGIFNVSISIAYGEGSQRAFSRLLQEIFNSTTNIVDIFNWAGSYGTNISCLLPSAPKDYLRCAPLYMGRKPLEPLTLTHLGLRVPILLMPAISTSDPTLPYQPIGDYYSTVDFSPLAIYLRSNHKTVAGSYNLLDQRVSGADGWKEGRNWFQLTFGILNFGGEELKIKIPKQCLAIGLQFYPAAVDKIPTEEPVVFTLYQKWSPDGNYIIRSDYPWGDYEIERSQLEKHGMKLVTLYL